MPRSPATTFTPQASRTRRPTRLNGCRESDRTVRKKKRVRVVSRTLPPRSLPWSRRRQTCMFMMS